MRLFRSSVGLEDFLRKKPQTNENKSSKKQNYKLWYLKTIFVFICLPLACGLIVSYETNLYLRSTYLGSFDGHSKEIYKSLDKIISNNLNIIKTIAAFAGDHCPNSSNWPNCTIPTKLFASMTESLLSIDSSRVINVTPILKPEEESSFETFAYRTYSTDPGYAPKTAINSPFGKGIWVFTYPNLFFEIINFVR
jgi:hypothetical protein